MKRRGRGRRPHRAFTLVEVLVVIAIIGLLGALLFPNFQGIIQKARGQVCAGNLRLIGVAVAQAAIDNNNSYPEIDQAATPIYPPGSDAKGLVEALGPYGVTTNTVQCPVDVSAGPTSSFKKYGSSYEWNPIFDDGNTVQPLLVINKTVQIPVNSARVRLCTDFTSLHKNRQNALYGDGHVTAR